MGAVLMNKLLTELEEINLKMEQVYSLLNCICSKYFVSDEPNVYDLEAGYTEYVNTIDIVNDIIWSQTKRLNETTKQLHGTYLKLEAIAKQNLAVLRNGVQGGGSNG